MKIHSFFWLAVLGNPGVGVLGLLGCRRNGQRPLAVRAGRAGRIPGAFLPRVFLLPVAAWRLPV